MKNIFKSLSSVLCWIILFAISADSYAQEYSKLNEVPQWVKDKVTPEEYELWKVMSTVFQVDYSFLKVNLSEERRLDILQIIQKTVPKIQDGSYEAKKGSQFCVADEYKVDTLQSWSTEVLECRKQSGIIYSNRDGYDAHFKLTVIYGYDKQNGKVYPIKTELEGISSSGLDIIQNDMPIVSFTEVDGKMQGTCSGTLFFHDKAGKLHSDNFTKYFILEQ